MTSTLNTMLQYFSDSKLAGSYFLLFLVSIVLLYYMNKEKNVWFILYGIVLLVVVVMNPLAVWIMSLVFPVLSSYGPLTLLIPTIFYIPFAATELTDCLKNRKIRHLVVIILVFLMFICGNMCGLVKEYSVSEANKTTAEEISIVEYLNANSPQMVLADESLVLPISARGNRIPLFYGRDLWTANLDTGIMDGYNEEAYTLFDAMKCTEDNAKFIADTAYEYGCDTIVMDIYEDAPVLLGKYKLDETTENYLIYVVK